MIYFYINKESDSNDLIFKVSNENKFAVIRNNITLQTFPNEVCARAFRQILFSFEAISYLQNNFDDLVFSTDIFWEYGRNLTKEQIFKILNLSIKQCKILINYDEFPDSKNIEFENLKAFFIETHNLKENADDYIFSYKKIVADSNEKERLRQMIIKINS